MRVGANTLKSYDDNPPNSFVQKNDIYFWIFEPCLKIGRPALEELMLANDPYKHKLKKNIETDWYETKEWFGKQTKLTGAEFYQYIMEVTKNRVGLTVDN